MCHPWLRTGCCPCGVGIGVHVSGPCGVGVVKNRLACGMDSLVMVPQFWNGIRRLDATEDSLQRRSVSEVLFCSFMPCLWLPRKNCVLSDRDAELNRLELDCILI